MHQRIGEIPALRLHNIVKIYLNSVNASLWPLASIGRTEDVLEVGERVFRFDVSAIHHDVGHERHLGSQAVSIITVECQEVGAFF